MNIKYFLLLQLFIGCSSAKNSGVINTIDVVSNVNSADTKMHLVKKVFYKDPNIVDSIYFYDKDIKCCSVSLLYDSTGNLVKQQEKFLTDTFLNKEVTYI